MRSTSAQRDKQKENLYLLSSHGKYFLLMLYRKNAQLREVRTMSFSCSMKHKFCVILVAFRMSGGTAMPLGITAGNLGSRNQPVRNDVYIPQIQQTKLSQNSNYSETQLMALNIKTTHYFLFLFWIYSFSLISTHYCCLLTVPVNKLVNVPQKYHAL